MVFKLKSLLIRDVVVRSLGHHKVVLWPFTVGGCLLGTGP